MNQEGLPLNWPVAYEARDGMYQRGRLRAGKWWWQFEEREKFFFIYF
jgi:hypothetical protein